MIRVFYPPRIEFKGSKLFYSALWFPFRSAPKKDAMIKPTTNCMF